MSVMTMPATTKVVRDYLLMRAIDSPVIWWASTVGPPDPHRTMIDLHLRWFAGEDIRDATEDAVDDWPDNQALFLLYGACRQLPAFVLEFSIRYDAEFRDDVTRRALATYNREV